MKFIANLSLKYKLILLLVALTGSMLSTYGLIALRDFEKDKIAYVLDSSLSSSRSTALQTKAEMSYILDRAQFLMRGYQDQDFHPFSKSIFKQEKYIDATLSFNLDEKSGQYTLGGLLKKDFIKDSDIEDANKLALQLIPVVIRNEIALYRSHSDKWSLAIRFDQPNGSPIIMIAVMKDSHFLGLFETPQMQDTYLVDDTGRPVLSPKEKTYQLSETDLSAAVKNALASIKSPEGTYQFKRNKNDVILVSVATVGLGKLKVISVVTKSAATQAVYAMMLKSGLFLVFLFFVTIFLSVLASTKLTESLKVLLNATQEIARGNFTAKVVINSEDEVGALSLGFNRMAEEIDRLLKETAVKARMEVELKTAKIVQSTLFPKSHFSDGDIEICGFYEPASECSGDWWFYKRIGHQTLFCIGDATGHGVPAALLTAAARSAASTLEAYPNLPLSEIMSVFNKAIYHTANGQLMMTFFLGSYDHNTGMIKYANASHEAPYLIPNDKQIKKADLKFLDEVRGPRLGENPDSVYEVAELQLKERERILLYTDGVTEMKGSDGSDWGERNLIKCLLLCKTANKSVLDTVGQLAQEMEVYRDKQILHDDVTYFMIEKSKAS